MLMRIFKDSFGSRQRTLTVFEAGTVAAVAYTAEATPSRLDRKFLKVTWSGAGSTRCWPSENNSTRLFQSDLAWFSGCQVGMDQSVTCAEGQGGEPASPLSYLATGV